MNTTLMPTTKSIIVVSSVPQQGFVITLEGTSFFLTILVAALTIIGVGIQIVSKFNAIANKIRGLEEDLNAHTNSPGHEKLIQQVEFLQRETTSFDKRFDIHVQDYVNYKDAVLVAIRGCDEKIDHKWDRSKEEFDKDRAEIKDLRGFLTKTLDFRMRE